MAGQGYGPHVLPFIFDLVSIVNDAQLAQNKRGKKEESVPEDQDGSGTIKFLSKVREMAFRICSVHPSSLGLHPALYFYSPNGVFQPASLLSFVILFKDWDTKEFKRFTSVRSKFEEFLLTHRGITEAVRKLGSGGRSRPRITAFYRTVLDHIHAGKTAEQVHQLLMKNTEFAFMFADIPDTETNTGNYKRRKGWRVSARRAAYCAKMPDVWGYYASQWDARRAQRSPPRWRRRCSIKCTYAASILQQHVRAITDGKET